MWPVTKISNHKKEETKMKKLLALALTAALALSTVAGCTPSAPASDGSQPTSTSNTGGDPIKLTLLTTSSTETYANVVRDQLTKQGFEVELSMQPDSSTKNEQLLAGNYDISINQAWVGTGTGDYAVRINFYSTGTANYQQLNDPEVDELIDLAATQVPEEAAKTYADLEEILVDEQAYMVPGYIPARVNIYNSSLLKPVTVYSAREAAFERFDYIDESKRETDVLYISNTHDDLPTLDPARSDSGNITTEKTNMMVRLMNLNVDNSPTTDATITRAYVIGEGNQDFYFLLRDDINFAKVENKRAVDTGVMVSGEDVVYSLNRARDKDSVPNNISYSSLEMISNVEMVPSIDELQNTTASDGSTLLDALNAQIDTPITALTEVTDEVDNAAGVYQVVKVSTFNPAPQVLQTLAICNAGILCKEQVEKVNAGVDFANYDPATDVLYGDTVTYTEGEGYDNQMWFSGPYCLLYKNDYEIAYEKNPNFMVTDEENTPKIRFITSRIIKDKANGFSAIRAGELGFYEHCEESWWDIIEQEEDLALATTPSSNVYHLIFNLGEGHVTSDVNIRKAILNSCNQDELISVFLNRVSPCYSTLTPVVDTGRDKFEADPSLVPGYIQAYRDSLAEG